MTKRRFAELRREKGLTQAELADKLQMGTQTMYTWESGVRTPPVEKLEILADFYGVSTDYILGRTDIRTYGQTPTAQEMKQDLTVGETMLDDPSTPQIDSNLLSAIETVVKKVLAEQQMASHQ